jgi:hypothetical protein
MYRFCTWEPVLTGKEALRAIIADPTLELVRVNVARPEKSGVDAGRLCGVTDVGVVATDNLDAVLALAPDCVVIVPPRFDMDAQAAHGNSTFCATGVERGLPLVSFGRHLHAGS